MDSGGCIEGCFNYFSGGSAGTVWNSHASQRPYHRHCNCALHRRGSSSDLTACATETAKDKVPCLFRRSWSDTNLSLSTSTKSSPHRDPKAPKCSSLSETYESEDESTFALKKVDGSRISAAGHGAMKTNKISDSSLFVRHGGE